VVDQRSDPDGARRARRTHVLIVLPDSDGELGRVLNVVEEMLLVVEGLALDDGELPPGVCPDREAVDAVGCLASRVGNHERWPPTVQPVAPDGRFELVPLFLVPMPRADLALVVAAVRHLLDAVSSGLAVEVLNDLARTSNVRTDSIADLRRLEALLQLDCDDDAAVLQHVFDRSAPANSEHSERIVLGAAEYSAYRRVTDRLLPAWHRDDCLAPFLYRGVEG
jgi:hypothetical protein